jgi:hypothetical protein
VAAVMGRMGKRQTIVVVQLFGSRVLGESDLITEQENISPIAQNYFYQEPLWQKYFSLDALRVIDMGSNYLLTLALACFFFSYRKKRDKNQINIKQPIINRYQPNGFRE